MQANYPDHWGFKNKTGTPPEINEILVARSHFWPSWSIRTSPTIKRST